MFYQNLKFPKVKGRPFFYTNFVSTLDGKVAVKRAGYWPIGSRNDYEVLTELRLYADCLVHGGNLAREFGEITQRSLKKPDFKKLRRKLGKNPSLPYYIITNKLHTVSSIDFRYSFVRSDLNLLIKEFWNKGYKHILVEGGPTLLGSFLNENLIDEIFLTIAPKIYGSQNLTTKNLVEGQLFPPNQIKHLKLISVKKLKDELFLRYSVRS